MTAVSEASETQRLSWSAHEKDMPVWGRACLEDSSLHALAAEITNKHLDGIFLKYSKDPEFVSRLQASVWGNLNNLRGILLGHLSLRDIEIADPELFASIQAKMGIPSSSLQKTYRIGFFMMWEKWSQFLISEANSAGIPAEASLSSLANLAEVIFGYQHHVASLVADAHAVTDEANRQSRGHLRQRLIRELLQGSETLTNTDILTIGYDLDVNHLAICLPYTSEEECTKLVAICREVTSANHVLIFSYSLTSTFIFIGKYESWTDSQLAKLRDSFEQSEIVASFGCVETGARGMKASFAQAERAEGIRAAKGIRYKHVTASYSDLNLEILLMQDSDSAAEFVRRELGELAEPGERSWRLCETLEAWFRLGSHVAAAEELELHEHTVRNRLRKVEEILGRGLNVRSTELRAALRLRPLLVS